MRISAHNGRFRRSLAPTCFSRESLPNAFGHHLHIPLAPSRHMGTQKSKTANRRLTPDQVPFKKPKLSAVVPRRKQNRTRRPYHPPYNQVPTTSTNPSGVFPQAFKSVEPKETSRRLSTRPNAIQEAELEWCGPYTFELPPRLLRPPIEDLTHAARLTRLDRRNETALRRSSQSIKIHTGSCPLCASWWPRSQRSSRGTPLLLKR